MKQRRQNPTCYMCDAPSTGKDHVPPLCLFPNDVQHRKSLVKVWSCDKHNSGKSKDDEWLRWVLATAGRNDIAVQISNDAVGPRLEMNPHLRTTFQPDAHFVVRDGKLERASWAVNPLRLITSITAIVRGLFYHHAYYTTKLTANLQVYWDCMKDRQAAIDSMSIPLADYEEFTRISSRQPQLNLGANPQIFQYAFDQDSDPTYDFCALRFYAGETIYVRWEKQSPQTFSTSLKSLKEYFDEFPQMHLQYSEILLRHKKEELIRQCKEREERLAEIAREARHKRDFAAYNLVKLLRKENYKNERCLSKEPL